MNTDVTKIIKQELAAGKTAPEIRVVLLEYGENLDDHYDTYFALQKDNESNAKANVQTQKTQFDSFGGPDTIPVVRGEGGIGFIGLLVRLVIVLSVLGLFVFIALGESDALLRFVGLGDSAAMDAHLSAEDISHRTTLQGMSYSAQLYKNKILDYGGLCRSIGIDASVYRCTENRTDYAIETRLSTGEFYCVDSSGFEGVTTWAYGSELRCAP